MNEAYRDIAHKLDMRYVNFVKPYVGWNLLGQGWHPFSRTFKEIDVGNIDILKSVKEPKLYFPYPHSSWVDTYLLPYILKERDFEYPISIAGNNLPMKPIFRRLGCSIFN